MGHNDPAQQGKRCTPKVMMDDNTRFHKTKTELYDESRNMLVGVEGGQQEGRHGPELRTMLLNNQLQALHTLAVGSGQTWRGNGDGGRID